MEIPNEDYFEEKRRQREEYSPSSPLPNSPPVYYVLHGGGRFVESRGERFMRFDSLEKAIDSHAIAAFRERFFRSHGGYLTNEQLSNRHNLSPNLSDITQEQINNIRRLGGTVFLSQMRSQFSKGYLPLHFYFQSNTFTDANE
jgi:hypothetical protein